MNRTFLAALVLMVCVAHASGQTKTNIDAASVVARLFQQAKPLSDLPPVVVDKNGCLWGREDGMFKYGPISESPNGKQACRTKSSR